MANLRNITGLNKVLANMKKSEQLIGKRLRRGLIVAGLFLKRESQKIVPVDEGNLKNSAFVRPAGFGFHSSVIVGYTAEYAVYVHEDLEAAHGAAYNQKHAVAIEKKYGKGKGGKPFKARGENQQAKFLEKPARENRELILAMIAKEIAK